MNLLPFRGCQTNQKASSAPALKLHHHSRRKKKAFFGACMSVLLVCAVVGGCGRAIASARTESDAWV